MIAIDPGNIESGVAIIRPSDIFTPMKLVNEDVIKLICSQESAFHPFAIEMIASQGMAVGATVFETCVWIGRFVQALTDRGIKFRLVYRSEVKIHMCGSMRAKDKNIRQSLIDRFGGPGKKSCPGKLYGFSGDSWQALAVGITALETSPKEKAL